VRLGHKILEARSDEISAFVDLVFGRVFGSVFLRHVTEEFGSARAA